ncbi:MAG: AAA family ATPase [Balneola sp.]
MQRPPFELLFEQVVTYPDSDYQERLNDLVGLDSHIERLRKMLGVLVNPFGIEQWQKQHHQKADKLLNFVLKRPPLVVLAGDVGSGKTELATTIGDAVARQEKIDIELYPLSLATRGEGRVGQMTQLVTAAFDYTYEKAAKLKGSSGKSRGAVILMVDEADSLTQSRENSQMHHEDRAGVNAFIRGIDRLANAKVPAAVILCTNRSTALDPAIKRRAAEILSFSRPNTEQRLFMLTKLLAGLELTEEIIKKLADSTGPNEQRTYGLTYSDLTQRLIPAMVFGAYPDQSISPESAINAANGLIPTPPFNDEN